MLSLEQQRARTAYAIAGDDDNLLSDTFVALTRQLPLMLRINGLLATWAHLCAKDEPQHRQMLSILQQHLTRRGLLVSAQGKSEPKTLYRKWVGDQSGAEAQLTPDALRALTDETQQFSGWLKRAVDACATGETP